MKKTVFLLLLLVSSYSYASLPKKFYGFQLGMNRQEVETLANNNNLSKMGKKNIIPHDISYYEGTDIVVYGVGFDNIKIYYDDNDCVEGLVFKRFIPSEEGSQRRIFKHLHDEIKPTAYSRKNEGIRFNYLFRFKEKKENIYIRISIKEVLQRGSGYDIVLTCGPTNAKLSAD